MHRLDRQRTNDSVVLVLILVLLLALVLILLVMRIRILLVVWVSVLVVVLRIIPPTTDDFTTIHVVWRALMILLLLLLPNSLMLHLEALVANLVTIHLLNGTLGGVRRVIRDEAESLGFARVPIDINLGRYDIPKRSKGRDQIWIGQIVREMIDEKVGSRWTLPWPRTAATTAATTASARTSAVAAAASTSTVLSTGIGMHIDRLTIISI